MAIPQPPAVDADRAELLRYLERLNRQEEARSKSIDAHDLWGYLAEGELKGIPDREERRILRQMLDDEILLRLQCIDDVLPKKQKVTDPAPVAEYDEALRVLEQAEDGVKAGKSFIEKITKDKLKPQDAPQDPRRLLIYAAERRVAFMEEIVTPLKRLVGITPRPPDPPKKSTA